MVGASQISSATKPTCGVRAEDEESGAWIFKTAAVKALLPFASRSTQDARSGAPTTPDTAYIVTWLERELQTKMQQHTAPSPVQ